MDLFCEKRIRHTLDELVHLHSLALPGQLPPGFLNVRSTYRWRSIQCDLNRIRKDVAARRPHQDMMFDLRVVLVASDGRVQPHTLSRGGELEDSPPH